MRYQIFTGIGLLVSLSVFCQKTTGSENGGGGNPPPSFRPASLGWVGDSTDVQTTTSAGIVIMGGGTDVDAAFQWMIERSGGGNAVIIRASGTSAYNPYVYKLGKLASVETLKIDSRDLADNESVARIIRNAELLFIAGGDQSNYMNYWRGTKTADALNYLLTVKKVPVGGTSAGAAILGSLYYSGEAGSATSGPALANPYTSTVTLYQDDFLQAPFLKNVITDQHYVARNRQGRHLAFLARLMKDKSLAPKGIAVDEKTAVCIDKGGIAKVVGSSKAYFLFTERAKQPEACILDQPLQWVAGNKAVRVYELLGTAEGNGNFSVADFGAGKAQGGTWYWWWVENGEMKQSLF
jgi:cyanophycinase